VLCEGDRIYALGEDRGAEREVEPSTVDVYTVILTSSIDMLRPCLFPSRLYNLAYGLYKHLLTCLWIIII
jgi:hypothetical protein